MPAFVPAAARTMSLFEAFAQQRREMSNAEIAKLLGMAESSCSDLLHTLHGSGYLMRTARSRRFYPTTRLMTLAASIAANDPVVAAGRDAIELLGERTGETALCGMLGDHHVEVLGIKEGRYELRYISAVGTRIGLHVSALGKALLAAVPPKEAARLLGNGPLKAVTPHSITDPALLVRQLREVRKRGYAQVEGEGTEGVSAMAVAGLIGEQLLAISLSGPSERFKRNREAYREALLAVRAQVFAEAGAEGEATETGAG